MATIELTQGYQAIIDDDDYEKVAQYKWHACKSFNGNVYAMRWIENTKPRKAMRLSYFVLGLTPQGRKILVDHRNRKTLDNRKENLRVANKSINAFNSDRSINASFIYHEKSRDRYKAFVPNKSDPREYIGTYKTYEEAHTAQKLYVDKL